jgi:hypothetical protein
MDMMPGSTNGNIFGLCVRAGNAKNNQPATGILSPVLFISLNRHFGGLVGLISRMD